MFPPQIPNPLNLCEQTTWLGLLSMWVLLMLVFCSFEDGTLSKTVPPNCNFSPHFLCRVSWSCYRGITQNSLCSPSRLCTHNPPTSVSGEAGITVCGTIPSYSWYITWLNYRIALFSFLSLFLGFVFMVDWFKLNLGKGLVLIWDDIYIK